VSDVSCDYANGLLVQLEAAERALAEARAECERLRAQVGAIQNLIRRGRKHDRDAGHIYGMASYTPDTLERTLDITTCPLPATHTGPCPHRPPFPPRGIEGRPELTESFEDDQPAAPARTEAEQAVLDAMAAAPLNVIQTLAAPSSILGKWTAHFASAELARRGLKIC
jgi:hypothetical protein